MTTEVAENLDAAAALSPTSKTMHRISIVLSAVLALFLVMDISMKLWAMPVVLETTARLGFPAEPSDVRRLGLLLLVCTVLYIIPRTAILGAVLLTGYFGGAVATHVRVGDPLFTHVLFGVYLGVFAWGGLFLRDAQLRALFPIRR